MKTSDQIARERIRTSLDATLIVEAAAGTGKTSELVRRIVAVLRTGQTTVDRVVAVTFMRKAAGELRLRLRLELDAARATASSDLEVKNLEDALKRLEEARIGTIHSFCAEILRQRPVEARIPPGFEELDQSQAAAMYSRAEWKASRASRLQQGSTPSLAVFIATDAPEPPPGYAARVEIIQIPQTVPRPTGPRFGSLVHLLLRDASLTATKESLLQLAQTHGRLLAATNEEIQSAVLAVFDALQHPLLERVRQECACPDDYPGTDFVSRRHTRYTGANRPLPSRIC